MLLHNLPTEIRISQNIFFTHYFTLLCTSWTNKRMFMYTEKRACTKWHLGTRQYAASPVLCEQAQQHAYPILPACAATLQLPTGCQQMTVAVWQVLLHPSYSTDISHHLTKLYIYQKTITDT